MYNIHLKQFMQEVYSAGQFYNDEYNRLNAKKAQVDGVLNSQYRLAALNDSYRKRYAKYIEILMVLIIAYGVYLGISLLQKKVPAIPPLVVDIATIVIMALVTIYLFNAITTLRSRNTLDFDELDIPAIHDGSGIAPMDASAQAAAVGTGVLGPSGEDCVGADCCPGITGAYWNPDTNRCDGNTQAGFTTLEYSAVDKAYTDLSFQDSSLKRAPITGQVGVEPTPTRLVFSPA